LLVYFPAPVMNTECERTNEYVVIIYPRIGVGHCWRRCIAASINFI